MSWQAYVDSNLVGSGNLAQGAILGAAGGVWAASAGFSITAAEVSALVAGFASTSSFQASGVNVAGVKYMFLRGDERTVQAKKGATGVVLVKTKQSILVGVYNDKQQPGAATLTVEKLADYLIENGY
eukprot:TRINITY_DN19978_c0_g1_i1.p1 TRINITY_DN19978_c0_g1~~TRINITY_DN19978_c0_g1_i1.p1  ORF type:complete len:127 (+),score=29.35 TRINITY_DN19978_c0_g1_i1:88-468(+)